LRLCLILFGLNNDCLDLGQTQFFAGTPTLLAIDDAKVISGETDLNGLLLPFTLNAYTEFFNSLILADETEVRINSGEIDLTHIRFHDLTSLETEIRTKSLSGKLKEEA